MQQEIKVRELAEQFFKDEIKKLDDPQRKEEVEHEEETYIGVWMMGYRAGEAQHPAGCEWVKNALEWAKETIAFADKEFDCPRPLVETWGNMVMNVLNAIQEAEREIESPSKEGNKEREIAFAEWVCSHGYWPIDKGHWNHAVNKTTTTEQLYNEYQKQK